MNLVLLVLAWLLLLVFAWPLAIAAMLLFPLALLIALPLGLAWILVGAILALVKALLYLPARVLGYRG